MAKCPPQCVSALLRVDFRRAIQGLDGASLSSGKRFSGSKRAGLHNTESPPGFLRGSESEEPVVGASEVLGFRKTVR